MIKSIVQLVTFVAGVAAVTPEIEGTEGMVSTDLARQLELFSRETLSTLMDPFRDEDNQNLPLVEHIGSHLGTFYLSQKGKKIQLSFLTYAK